MLFLTKLTYCKGCQLRINVANNWLRNDVSFWMLLLLLQLKISRIRLKCLMKIFFVDLYLLKSRCNNLNNIIDVVKIS